MVSPASFSSIVLLLALCSPRVAEARPDETVHSEDTKELCPDVPTVGGKPCLPICGSVKVDYAAIPTVHFTNRSIDSETQALAPEERFHFFRWNPCPGRFKYPFDPEEYYLLRNGTLFVMNKPDGYDGQFRSAKAYCFSSNNGTLIPNVCFPDIIDKSKALFICGLVNVPFLIATVWIYSVLPELRNTHGKTLRCYLCCLIVYFVTRAATTNFKVDSWIPCLLLGYTAYFSCLTAFFWLNVMCFNMWWMFGGFGALRSNATQRSRQNFIYYSKYAWGVPALLTIVCMCVEFVPDTQGSPFNPRLGSGACWFRSNESINLFARGPIGLTIAGNIFFFISTSRKLSERKSNGNKTNCSSSNGTHHDQNAHFSLYLKLFVVMGIGWTSEVMGWWFVDPPLLWFSIAIVNALQGIPIFIILVCKKNVLISLKERYVEASQQAADYVQPYCGCISKWRKSDNVDSRASYTVETKRNTILLDVTNSSQVTQ